MFRRVYLLKFVKRMAHQFASNYAWGYETPSNSEPIRATATPSHPPKATRQNGGHDCPNGRRRPKVGLALATNLSAVRALWLTRSPIPGRPSYLSAGQKEHLAQGLLRGAQAAGYPTELWTLKRIAKVIWKEFHVRYHPHALWHLLRRMGWSCQKPDRRACQRDEAAIAQWRRYRWPHIKKGRAAWRAPGFPG